MGDAFRRLRQAVGLRVIDHLQPVLEYAEVIIGFLQQLFFIRINQPILAEFYQCIASGTATQHRLAPAPDELVDLGKKFNLADTALTEFDIMSGQLDIFIQAAVHLAFNGVDVDDGSEIEVTPPHERGEAF